MPSRPITSFYKPSATAVLSSLYTPDLYPGGRCESSNTTRSRHNRKRSCDIENVRHDYGVSAVRIKKDRRRTIDCGLVRPSFTPRDDTTHQVIRILPQRIVTPGESTSGVKSIWFQSESEHPDFGVSLVDIVDSGAEGLVVAPQERIFQGFGLDCDEIQFSILWPGYGHISWIASIPTNFFEESGHQCKPVTRGLLASAIAEHFRAFMTNHAHLRFPHPDPRWKIKNDQENGIRFEDLRLTRLFSHRDGAGDLGPWQAEILVADNHPTYTH